MAEIPGAGGISSADSLARLYAACVAGLGGPALLTIASIKDSLRVQSAGPQLTGQPDDGTQWGTGFQLSSAPAQPLFGSGSFGHSGAGGQLAFGDIDYRASFAYVTNQMGGYGDARARSLVDATRRVLEA
jgi:CubicO group peptidase (beta-lactamase class C family)